MLEERVWLECGKSGNSRVVFCKKRAWHKSPSSAPDTGAKVRSGAREAEPPGVRCC